MSENIYIVSKTVGGRIVLDSVSHGDRLQIIRAKDWVEARKKVTVPCYHNPGYGWIHDDQAGAA
jgi:hypothetical protein